MTSVTESDRSTENDRALWQAYVRQRRELAPTGAGGDEAQAGEDAMLVAAYLDNRLDDQAQAAFERRLVDEPQLLETVIAARAAVGGPALAPEAVPQGVVAFALGLRVPARAAPRARETAGRRPWIFASPAFAWSIATVAFVSFAALGAFIAIDHGGVLISAEAPERRGSAADDLDRRSESIFADPAKAYFDGTEVDD
jgi:hypothetical protein